ncbi:hypothetical protein Ancab_002024 [Ancistrocladus abbreviatus]
MIPVASEDSRYLVSIFEESSGETIFSRGKDWDRATENLLFGNGDGHLSKDSGYGSSIVPCSLSRQKNKGHCASLAEHRSIGGASDSKLLDSSDYNHYKQDNLRQCKQNETNRPSPGKNGKARVPIGEHVSSTANYPVRALMAEKTADLKRRKIGEKIGFKPDIQFVALVKEGAINDMEEGHPGPILQGPLCLGSRLEPKKPGAKCSKPRDSKSNTMKKRPIKKYPATLDKRGTTNEAEEIWEVGKCLGVQSAEDKETIGWQVGGSMRGNGGPKGWRKAESGGRIETLRN